MQVLKVIRQHGKTLEEVARALGVTKGTFSVTINNKPKLQRLFDIANYLNCSPAEFFADWDTAPENIHRIAEQQKPEEVNERASEQSEVDEKPADDVQKEQKNDDLPFKDDKEKEHQQKQTQEQPQLQPVAAFLCPHCGETIMVGLKK